MRMLMVVICALVVTLQAKAHYGSPDWYAVARCETGSNWHMHGSSYSGGLGIYNPTWRWWARELGYSRYATAGDAPASVQITVAQYGYSHHNGYWGCL